MQDKRAFVHSGFTTWLRQHSHEGNAQGAWGKMNFQQMVEHLVLSVKSANGSIASAQITPDDQLAKWQAFLRDDAKAFRENTKSPSFPAEPLPLHFASVEAAINKLQKEIDLFFEVYENNTDLRVMNPVFGPLDFSLGLSLLYKHFQHHARQFGMSA